ncbi:hypothetical protein MBLNU230_g0654t1 [Neophaeotheca triangularis]
MKSIIAAAIAVPALLATCNAQLGLQVRNANFDDIEVNNPRISTQPIGTYKGLNWDGFNVIDVSGAPTGVAAQSDPNVAVQYILSTGPALTARLQPASDRVNYFALQSFYFGCVASSQETVVGVPVACQVRLTGRRNGRVVVEQDINYNPRSLQNKMKFIEFADRFANVDEIDFQQRGLLAPGTSVLYDNVRYNTFTGLI